MFKSYCSIYVYYINEKEIIIRNIYIYFIASNIEIKRANFAYEEVLGSIQIHLPIQAYPHIEVY